MTWLNVVGLDPSLRNWGIAKGRLNLDTLQVEVTELNVVNPVLPSGKSVRTNSKDLLSAQQLAEGTLAAVKGAHVIFAEVPVGSQSARAMASYGICVGVLGAIRAMGTPFFEVSPTQVKQIVTGKSTATKREVIQWAYDRHPNASWPFYKKNNQQIISEAKAEHMADAIAAIHAGIASNEFRLTLPILKQVA